MLQHEHEHRHDQHIHNTHEGHSPNAFKNKFWTSLALTLPTLIFSHTVQSWFGLSFEFTGSSYIPAIFGATIFFYGGFVFLKGAQTELKNHTPGMMTLISMAISVAFIYSFGVTVGIVDGMDFWWELATLVTIMLLGHWIEMASVQNAQGALKELAKLLPDTTELINGKIVAVNALKIGDKIIVRPGGRIPSDGIVVNGESDVNESMLTGESKPVKKLINTEVIGGTINGSGSLTVKITRVGSDTALAGIMKLIAEAQASRSKTQILADRAAFYLTLIAIGAAMITAITWSFFGQSNSFILERVVTVLVIACPHALGLAIPLVTAISTTKAANSGLLIRQRLALESARNIDVILFDKTGTLTRGEQGVVGIISIGNDKDLLKIAASVENASEHPIARAIVRKANELNLKLLNVSHFSALSGRGATASIGNETYYIGRPRLLKERDDQKVSKKIQNAITKASEDGKTIVYVLNDSNGLLGAIMLADVIRDESRDAVATLQKMGKRVAMLTGDSKGVASWVSRELGLNEFFADVLPEHKAETVKMLQEKGNRVAMIGDGVNDAPALTQADIGIAIGAGTDVAIESAGIVLASSDPRGVAKIVKLSKASYRKMQQNLAWATGYNIIAIPLAAGVTATYGFILSPALGAVLMSLSTIIVALNAQLLRRLKL